MQDRHGVFAQARAGPAFWQNEELRKSGAGRLCREFAAAAFAAQAASLLQAAAQVGGSSSKTYFLSVSCEVCNLARFGVGTTCGISIFRHAAFMMFVDRGHR